MKFSLEPARSMGAGVRPCDDREQRQKLSQPKCTQSENAIKSLVINLALFCKIVRSAGKEKQATPGRNGNEGYPLPWSQSLLRLSPCEPVYTLGLNLRIFGKMRGWLHTCRAKSSKNLVDK